MEINKITTEVINFIGEVYLRGKRLKISYYGESSERPLSPEIGQEYFDTEEGKPIWWEGSKWVDSNGSDI